MIEFDEKNEFFKRRRNDTPDCGKLYNIDYLNKRHTIYVDDFKIDIAMFTSKIIDWKHEEEVRIFES